MKIQRDPDTASPLPRERARTGPDGPAFQAGTLRWLIAICSLVLIALALVLGARALDSRRPPNDPSLQTSVFVSPGPDEALPAVEVATSDADLQLIWSNWQVPGAPPPVGPDAISVAVWGGQQTGTVDINEFRWDGPNLVLIGTVAASTCPRLTVLGATVEVWSVPLPTEIDAHKVTATITTKTRDNC